MLISACIFGYGEASRELVKKFRELPEYGIKFRIHMIQVPSLRDYTPEVLLNSKGQWKLNDWAFEDEDQGISFGDDLEWLRERGWEGHDIVIDCSSDGEDFQEEIKFQMSTSPRMKLYSCTDISLVDALIEELKAELRSRADQYGIEYGG